MADKINPKQLGLTLGIFASLLHLIWSIAISISAQAMQRFIDWVSALHHINSSVTISSFTWIHTIILTILAFIIAYIVGFFLASIYNWAGKRTR